jgi:hypothetical protein
MEKVACMIDAKQAVQIAKDKAAEILGCGPGKLEEIERESYKDRDVWSITLSFVRDLERLGPIVQLTAEPLEYKRFLIDSETGDLVAIKLRELASR